MANSFIKAIAITGILLCISISAYAKSGKGLDDVLRSAGESGSIEAIIIFKGSAEIREMKRQGRRPREVFGRMKKNAEERQKGVKGIIDGARKKGKVRNDRSFSIVNSIYIETDEETLRNIANDPNVEMIVRNQEVSLMPPDVTAGATLSSAPQGWDRERIGIDHTKANGYKGQGVMVVIADTGVDAAHSELSGAYSGLWKDCYGDSASAIDENGHGTNVAGIIAGSVNGDAPDAKWAAVRVLGPNGKGNTVTCLCGFQQIADWAASGAYPSMRVTNNSWGGENSTVYLMLADALEAMGILQVASAGNTGANPETVGTPGDYPSIFTVGSTGYSDEVSSFSSRGPAVVNGVTYIKPDISAPGEDIYTTAPGGGYETVNGTSAAGPHAAAAVAIVMSAFPTLSNDEIRQFLKNTSVDRGLVGPDNAYGSGRLNLHPLAELSAAGPASMLCKVTDSVSGAAVFAQVLLKDASGAVLSGVHTNNATGECEQALVAPGTYSVVVSAYGYKEAFYNDITVSNPDTMHLFLLEKAEAECDWRTPGSPPAYIPSDLIAYIVNTGQMSFPPYDIVSRIWKGSSATASTPDSETVSGLIPFPENTGDVGFATYTFPQPGDFTVWLFADPTANHTYTPPLSASTTIAGTNRVPEIIDVTNNIATSTLCAHKPLPDIVVEQILIDPAPSGCSPTEGDALTISAVIGNIGEYRAGPFYVALYIDGTQAATSTVNLLFPYPQQASITVTFPWVAGLPAGSLSSSTREIKVKADSGGTIEEMNEGNNELTKALSVHPSGIDLQAVEILPVRATALQCPPPDEATLLKVRVVNRNGKNGQSADNVRVFFNTPGASVATQTSIVGQIPACGEAWFFTPASFTWSTTGAFPVYATATAVAPTVEDSALLSNNSISGILSACQEESPAFNFYVYSPDDIKFLSADTQEPISPAWKIAEGQQIAIRGVVHNSGPEAAPAGAGVSIVDMTPVDEMAISQSTTFTAVPAGGSIEAPAFTQAFFGPDQPGDASTSHNSGTNGAGEHIISLKVDHPDESYKGDNKTQRFLWVGDFNNELCIEFVATATTRKIYEGTDAAATLLVTDSTGVDNHCAGDPIAPESLKRLKFIAAGQAAAAASTTTVFIDVLEMLSGSKASYDPATGRYSFAWHIPCGVFAQSAALQLDAYAEAAAGGHNGAASLAAEVVNPAISCAPDRPAGLIADGADWATVYCTLSDSSGSPLPDQTVEFATSGTPMTFTLPASGPPYTMMTGAEGVATASLRTVSGSFGTAYVTGSLPGQDAACRASSTAQMIIEEDRMCDVPACAGFPALIPDPIPTVSQNCSPPASGNWTINSGDVVCVNNSPDPLNLSSVNIIANNSTKLTVIGVPAIASLRTSGTSRAYIDGAAFSGQVNIQGTSTAIFNNVAFNAELYVTTSANAGVYVSDSTLSNYTVVSASASACFNDSVYASTYARINLYNIGAVRMKNVVTPQMGITLYDDTTLIMEDCTQSLAWGLSHGIIAGGLNTTNHGNIHLCFDNSQIFGIRTNERINPNNPNNRVSVDVKDSLIQYFAVRMTNTNAAVSEFNPIETLGQPFSNDINTYDYENGKLRSRYRIRNSIIGLPDAVSPSNLSLFNGGMLLEIYGNSSFTDHNSTMTMINAQNASEVNLDGTHFIGALQFAKVYTQLAFRFVNDSRVTMKDVSVDFGVNPRDIEFRNNSRGWIDGLTCKMGFAGALLYYEQANVAITNLQTDTCQIVGYGTYSNGSWARLDLKDSTVGSAVNLSKGTSCTTGRVSTSMYVQNTTFSSSFITDLGSEFITQSYALDPDFEYTPATKLKQIQVGNGACATSPQPIVSGPFGLTGTVLSLTTPLNRKIPVRIEDFGSAEEHSVCLVAATSTAPIDSAACVDGIVTPVDSDDQAMLSFMFTTANKLARFKVCEVNTGICDSNNQIALSSPSGKGVGALYAEPVVIIIPEGASASSQLGIESPAAGAVVTDPTPLVTGQAAPNGEVDILLVSGSGDTSAEAAQETALAGETAQQAEAAPAQAALAPPEAIGSAAGYGITFDGIFGTSKSYTSRITLSMPAMRFNGVDYNGGTVLLDKFGKIVAEGEATQTVEFPGMVEKSTGIIFGEPVNLVLMRYQGKAMSVYAPVDWTILRGYLDKYYPGAEVAYLQHGAFMHDGQAYFFRPAEAFQMPGAIDTRCNIPNMTQPWPGAVSFCRWDDDGTEAFSMIFVAGEGTASASADAGAAQTSAASAEEAAAGTSAGSVVASTVADAAGVFSVRTSDLGDDGEKRIVAAAVSGDGTRYNFSSEKSFILNRSSSGIAVYNYPEPVAADQGATLFANVPAGSGFSMEIVDILSGLTVAGFDRSAAACAAAADGYELCSVHWDTSGGAGVRVQPGDYSIILRIGDEKAAEAVLTVTQ